MHRFREHAISRSFHWSRLKVMNIPVSMRVQMQFQEFRHKTLSSKGDSLLSFALVTCATLKGIGHQFWIYNIFFVPTKRNIFYKRFIPIKPLWLEKIEKKGCTKSVRVIYIIYIIVLGRTDFVHPLFSIISSQSGFIEMGLLQKMFLLVGHEKNIFKYVIYSKLVNNPFKQIDSQRLCYYVRMALS